MKNINLTEKEFVIKRIVPPMGVKKEDYCKKLKFNEILKDFRTFLKSKDLKFFKYCYLRMDILTSKFFNEVYGYKMVVNEPKDYILLLENLRNKTDAESLLRDGTRFYALNPQQITEKIQNQIFIGNDFINRKY